MSTRYLTEIAQVPEEIERWTEIVVSSGARSYLEVGSKFGGSLWHVASRLPPGSRVVSIDMPRGTKLWAESEPSLKGCIAALKAMGHDARVFWGSSTDEGIVAAIEKLGPFDACFLDGNHTMPYVTADFGHFGTISRIVGFHDIGWRRAPTWQGTRIDVPDWWEQHKNSYRHEEIKLCPTGKNNGIGVFWRH